jgi:hypothetical protein
MKDFGEGYKEEQGTICSLKGSQGGLSEEGSITRSDLEKEYQAQLGWEFQFLNPISGTPIGSGIPIPFWIAEIRVGFFFEFHCWKIDKLEFRFQNLEFQKKVT